jgi:hypothetical protein
MMTPELTQLQKHGDGGGDGVKDENWSVMMDEQEGDGGGGMQAHYFDGVAVDAVH